MILCLPAEADINTHHNCTTLPDLLYHLYHTDDNLLHLNRVFYPPRAQPPTFLNVTYYFKSKDQDELKFRYSGGPPDTDCSVNYIWAEGGFLLIQPPLIFQYTSLWFNQESGEESSIPLTLPSVCRELVFNTSTETCSCTLEDYSWLLDVVTQQVIIIMYSYNNHVLYLAITKILGVWGMIVAICLYLCYMQLCTWSVIIIL